MISLNQFAIIFWKNWKIFKNNPLSLIFNCVEIIITVIIVSLIALREGNDYHFESRNNTELQDVYSYKNFTNNFKGNTICFILPKGKTDISGEEFVNRFSNDPNIVKIINEQTHISIRNFDFKILDSEEELLLLNKKDNDNNIVAGVIFGQDFNEYTIRIKGNNIVDSNEKPISDYGKSRISEYIENEIADRFDYPNFYVNSNTNINHYNESINLKNKVLYYRGFTKADSYIGTFIPIQIAIDNIIFQIKTNGTIKGYSVDIGKLSKPPVYYHLNENENRKESFSGYALSIYVIFFGQILGIMSKFMKEKESGIRDVLLSIGANRIALWISWVVIYFPFSIFSIIMIFLIDSSNVIGFGSHGSINPILYFVYLVLYALAVFEMTICLCLVTRKTKSLILIISLTVVAVSAVSPSIYQIKFSDDWYLEKFFSFVFPPIGVSMASAVITYESNRNGYIGILSGIFINEFGVYFFFMIIDVIFYFLLAVYIDNKDWFVLPTRTIPLVADEELSLSYALDIQEDPFGGECYVKVRNIYKYYTYKKNFVNSSDNNDGKIGSEFAPNKNISFNVYKDEIFAILGHNGAGKSTLIQIMVGMIKPNIGECYYNEIPLSKNKNICQHHMGICLQNNVLIEDFTVVDYFILYCNIKEVMDDLDTWLQDFDLVEKRDCKVQYLSTGQKRKLCVGLAFLGNPKYVFLDEPTTGLDPVSRQKIWSLLLKKKRDRVIFLTTHYMDEADIIADRKLILKKGTVRCLGSSVYLKNHFQMKYSLEIETNKPRLVEEIIKYYVPEAEYFNDKTKIKDYPSLPRNTTSSYIWKLSPDYSPLFSHLIKKLEEEKQKGDILRNFSVSAPRLEELFVRLAKEGEIDNDKENEMQKNNKFRINSLTSEISMKNAIEFPSNDTIQKPNDIITAIRILHYRFKLNYRRKPYLGIAFLNPFFIYFIFFNHINMRIDDNNFSNFKSKTLSSEMYNGQQWNYDLRYPTSSENVVSTENVVSPYLIQQLTKHMKLSYKTNYEIFNIAKSIKSEPYYVSSFSGEFLNDTMYHFNIYYNDSMPHALPTTLNSLSNAILKYHMPEKDGFIQMNSYPLPYTDLTPILGNKIYTAFILSLCLSLMLSYCGFNVVHEKKHNLLKQLQLNGISNFSYWLSVFLSDYIWFILSSIVMILSVIIFDFEPFFFGRVLVFIGLIFLIYGIPCILNQYVFSFLFTSENVAFFAYFFINIFPIIFTIYTFFGFEMYDGNSFYIWNSNIALIVVDALLPFISFVEVIHNLLIIGINNITMEIPFTFGSLFSLQYQLTQHIIGAIMSIIVCLFLLVKLVKNQYTLNNTDVHPITKELEEKIEKEMREGDEDVYNEYERVKEDKDVNAIPIKLVNLMKEYNDIHINSHNEFLNAMRRMESRYGEYHLSRVGDKDRRRIVVTAFENINLGIDRCECFGVLGPNGSGKTSLLNTVSFTFNQTAGDILYNGKSTLERKANEITLGYCPQENTLWDEMTLQEHIEMFLYIRGCSYSESKSLAEQFIMYCRLKPHKDKFPTEMSGGTRRKLNILIALCCDSPHVLLDEPTSGMDPATRRYIWDVIKATLQRNQSSIIMTTHSMEEAELLCNRIGIIVNGKLQCIGTPEHLKMKFGHTYILDVHTNNVERFHNEMVIGLSLFGPDAKFKRDIKSQERVKYEIQHTSTNEIGRVFEIMESCRDMMYPGGEKIFIDYSYSQTTLEEVFINFARLKENYDNDEDSIGDYPII